MGNLKKSDLQIAAVTATGSATRAFSMAHQMGLLKGEIPAAATADNVIVYDGNTYDVNATGEKWERVLAECTSATWNASTTFTSSTNKPYHDTTNKILYYVAKTEDATISISATAGTQLYAWSVSGSSTTVSTKNVCKSFTIATPDYSNAFNQKIWKFSYSGEGKQWVAPHTGTYTMECWGAQGGGDTETLPGGKGAYTIGNLSLTSTTALFVFVGQAGDNVTGITAPEGSTLGNDHMTWSGVSYPYDPIFNNGFATYAIARRWICSGGGATDIRTIGGTWNNSTGLSSRIMVAAGGAGTMYYHAVNTGGAAGAYTGYNGKVSGSDGHISYGGTQIKGGQHGQGMHADNYTSYLSSDGYAVFGQTKKYDMCGSGGGGGWYCGGNGAHGSGTTGSGAGGSSYISGKSGCSTNGSYSFIDSDSYMIDGQGVKYTSTSSSTANTNIPSHTGYTAGLGHTGNGYARITYINQ